MTGITKQEIIDVLSKAVDTGIIPGMSFDDSRTLSIVDINSNVRATIEWYKNMSTLVVGENIVSYFDNVSIVTTHPRFACALAFTRDKNSVLYMGIKY